jgi:hypothetical protein
VRKRTFILIFILLSLFLVSCSEETSPSTKKSNHEKENITQTSISSKNSNTNTSKNNESKVSSNNDSSTTESKPKLRTDGKWLQCDARLYYLQGTVKQIGKNQDGKISMILLVEKAFQNPTSGVVIPYDIGKEYSFFLKEMPTLHLTNQRVIIYGGGITSNDQNRFLGAKIVYYDKNNRFVDFNGKEAVLPPTDYPYELK